MSDVPDARRIPKMPPEAAQEIALGWKWLAESYAQAGMLRNASRAELDSQWWLTYSKLLSQT